MVIKNKLKTYQIGDKLKIDILESGDIFKIYHQDTLINQLYGNLIDGMISNIYLRNIDTNESSPLIGLKSNAKAYLLKDQVLYEGNTLGVNYEVLLSAKDLVFTYQVRLEGSGNFDLFFTQDIGLNREGTVLNNEAYNAQYLDHKIFNTNKGFITLSRENQGHPNLLQIGSNTNIVSYSTDMLQFYGLDYKESKVIKGLMTKQLENRNLQYEIPLIALKTEEFKLGVKEISFYGKLVTDFEGLRDKPFDHKVKKINKNEVVKELKINKALIGSEIVGLTTNHPSTNKSFIERDQGGNLLSFFDGNKHVVMKEKEVLTERTHGHLTISGEILDAGNTMATTNFMNGVFGSRIVLGNTNFHRLNGDIRNQLGLLTTPGIRIYIKDKKWHLLGMPSYYELTANTTKWVYVLENDELTITSTSSLDEFAQNLTFKSKNNIKYDILVTNQLTVGQNEYVAKIELEKSKDEVVIKFVDNQLVNDNYPNLKYKIKSSDVTFKTDEVFFGSEKGHGLLVMEYQQKDEISIDILGTLDEFTKKDINWQEEVIKYEKFYQNLINFKILSDDDISAKFNKTLYWYTHSALIHYSSPHGLEQTGGAAWGTRDILQGPLELFTSLGRYDIARSILLKVYSRQFIETYDWPQWFMYDKYSYIQAHDSHGDIIVWPIKALADYLKITNDLSILDEKLTYFSIKKNQFVEGESLLNHVKNQINAIINSSVEGTSLAAYGGGDWNDTLQPKNQMLTKKMASSWTVSLIYEGMSLLSTFIKEKDKDLCKKINHYLENLKEDYYKYIVIDGKPAGFVVFDDSGPRPLLHPNDKQSGISYRLLSYQRPIIAGLLTLDEATSNHKLINKHLKFPDGLRLMNEPVKYQGGIKTYFQRAETASNFGREVGILYVHAHIRHLEMLAKLGYKDQLLEEFLQINPIGIRDVVKNANIRQSNLYFSSSDANFYDRYEAQENFELLRKGKVKVKSGWRLYSSGPGIYINQLITNYFGIKVINKNLYLDPVHNLDNVTVEFKFDNKLINVTYYQNSKSDKVVLNNNEIKIARLNNKYRKGAILIDLELLKDTNDIKVYLG